MTRTNCSPCAGLASASITTTPSPVTMKPALGRPSEPRPGSPTHTVTVRHAHIIDEICGDRVASGVAEQPCGHRVLDQRPDVDHIAPANARRDEDPGSADLVCHLSRTR